VDIHRAWGPAEHTVDYPLCFRGRLSRLEGVAADDLKPMASLTPGYRHILAAGPEAANGPWTGVWEREATEGDPDAKTTDGRRGGPASRVSATVLPSQQRTDAWVGGVPGDRHQAVLRRTGRDVTFACVVDPYLAIDVVASAKTIDVDGPVRASAVEVARRDGGTDLIIVRYDPMPDGTPGAPSVVRGIKTQSLVTVVRLDAKGKEMSRADLGSAGQQR